MPDSADYADLYSLQAPEPSAVEPTTPAERNDSESAYEGLSATESLDLLQEEFDLVVSEDPFPELDVPPGDEVAYVSPFAAVVGEELPDLEGPTPGEGILAPGEAGRNVLVESEIPISAPEGGHAGPAR